MSPLRLGAAVASLVFVTDQALKAWILFVFELPLRITPADAASMAQAEYDARFFLCALVAVVRAPETSTSGVYKRGNERSGPVDVGNLLYRLPMRYSYE